MKIGIATPYNGGNCGSYWQAAALKGYLEGLGHHGCFIKQTASNFGTRHTAKMMAACLRKGDLKGCTNAIGSHKAFSRCQKSFDVVDEYSSLDFVVLGSDTIWNLESSHYLAQAHGYWGVDAFKAGVPVASYAATVGNTSAELLDKHPELLEALQRLVKVSVRDEYSRGLLAERSGVDIDLVCDPTLLVEPSFYAPFYKKRESEYLLVYHFGKMPDALAQEVKDFAKKEGLEIVSFFGVDQFSRTRQVSDPMRFIELFANASYVVSNTYHGTMFTLAFEKQGVFNSAGKNKIADMLERLDLGGNDWAQAEGASVVGVPIDYSRVTAKIEQLRADSRRFLDEALSASR